MPTFSQRLIALLLAIALSAALAPAAGLAQDEEDTGQPTTTPPNETVVVSDTFVGPPSGILPEDDGSDENVRYEYDDDRYEMDQFAEDFSGELVVPIAGDYTDSTLAVDAQLTGPTAEQPGRYIIINCRFTDDSTGYQLEFRPLTATIILWRWDGEDTRPNRLSTGELNEGESMVAEPHRLELSCVEDQINAIVDGVLALSITDDTYQEGQHWIGGGVYSGSAGPLGVDFDNLAISIPTSLVEDAAAEEAAAQDEQAAEDEEAAAEEETTPDAEATPEEEAAPEEEQGAEEEEPAADEEPVAEEEPAAEEEEPTVEEAPAPDRSVLLAPAQALIDEATASDPTFGPEAGEIEQVVGGNLNQQLAGVNLSDFVAQATFQVPTGEASQRWDVGFGFRQAGNGQHWRVIVRSDGTWNLAVASEFPRATGIVENLNTGEGAENTLLLAVSGNTGYLLVNGAYTSTLDLSAWTQSGDIWIGSGYFLDDATEGAVTPYSDFTVWALSTTEPASQIVVTPPTSDTGGAQKEADPEAAEPEEATPVEEEPEPEATAEADEATEEPTDEATPAQEDETEAAEDPDASPETVDEDEEPEASPEASEERSFDDILASVEESEPIFGPEAGSVDQVIGSMDVEMAGVSVQDFYTSVRFSNPASPDEPDHPWDVVIGFWHTGGDDQVRLIISSDGVWSLALGTARPIETGSAPGLVLGAARGNVIDFAVVGTTGYLQINGEFVTTIDIPADPVEGDIWIASGSFPENVQEGIPTPFSAWSVWAIE